MKESWLFPGDFVVARAAQKEMALKVSLEDEKAPVAHIAGVDMSNTPFDPEQMIYGSGVVLSYPDLKVVHSATSAHRQDFPYIPGLLGFREVPALVEIYRQFQIKPDLIMVDGHGVSHPRGLGIASHLGVLLDVPTIGVAKSILVGTPEGSLGEEPGSEVPLVWKGREIGRVIRTKKRCSPLIVSAGHRISLETACQWVRRCLKGYRLPEPTRQAHLAANVFRKKSILGVVG